MPKFYFLLLFVLITFSASSQIRKNATFIGGQFAFNNDNNKFEGGDDESRNGSFNLLLGKALSENNVLGVSVGASSSKTEGLTIPYSNTNNRYNVGAFFRRYNPLGSKFYLFGQFDAGVSFGKEEVDYLNTATADTEGKEFGFNLGITPGVSYQLSKKIQVEVTLPNIVGLQYFRTKYETKQPQPIESTRTRTSLYTNLRTSLSALGFGFVFII
jgi:hypothetical protein